MPCRRQQTDLRPQSISQGVDFDARLTDQAVDLDVAWIDEPWHPGFIEGTRVNQSLMGVSKGPLK